MPPESSQAKVSRLISKNPPLPSCEMSIKLRRSRTEDGLLSSRKEKSQLLTLRDESRDSAFFSLNNTSLCLSPELMRPEESSSVYQQQVTNDLPKPLYLEVCSTTVDNLIAFLTTWLPFSGAKLSIDSESETGLGVDSTAGVFSK